MHVEQIDEGCGQLVGNSSSLVEIQERQFGGRRGGSQQQQHTSVCHSCLLQSLTLLGIIPAKELA